jgi:RNA-directed DNA polymerase
MINSVRNLAYLLETSPDRLREIADTVDSQYRPYHSEKGRRIDNPSVPLRRIQQRVYRKLLKAYEYSRFAVGGVPRRSLLDAVKPHEGRPLVIRIDVREFYPSISDEAIYDVWRRLGHGGKVCSLLTRLTTFNHRVPQGAPTSMALANLFMEPVDNAVMQSLSVTFPDIEYTRWVDDMIFSGTLDPEIVFAVVCRHLRDVGLKAHRARAKRRVMPSDARQEILGTVVNVKVSLSRRRRRLVRAIIHTNNRYGGDKKIVAGHLGYLKTFHQSLAEQLEDSIKLAPVLFKRTAALS